MVRNKYYDNVNSFFNALDGIIFRMWLMDQPFINFKNMRLKKWISTGLLTSAHRKQAFLPKCKKLSNNLKLVMYFKKYKS